MYDYVEYSRNFTLQQYKIHMNSDHFFEKNHNVISFDSEGQNPATLAQICSGKDIYLFDLKYYMDSIKKILQDDKILKIVFSIESEKKQFGEINNFIDLQQDPKMSLCKYINQTFNLNLKKNKRIHFNGWNSPWSQRQIVYAAADAAWTLKLYETTCVQN